jgi:2-dehydro-3-deoxyphosphogluconate aldolase / (4S)-4-hydroxy-2-oxoglutarate aldolase
VNKEEVCKLIEDVGIIPAIRVSSSDDAHFAVEAVTRGGIPIVEITMTSPQAVQLISHLVKFHPKVLVGAGTVLKIETAQQCVDAGAGFITAPGFNSQIVEFVVKQNVAVLAGALTPTEVVAASEAGSHFVKIFPCAPVGGEAYIKALNTALPDIPLIAAGGVNQQTARAFILAGATAIGVGKDLIPPEAIERRQADRIRELAHRFIGFVTEARQLLTARKRGVTTHKALEQCEKEAAAGSGKKR